MIRARKGRTKNGTRRMAGSRNRFSRKGLIAAGLYATGVGSEALAHG
mgnify:CR=1 FL=1